MRWLTRRRHRICVIGQMGDIRSQFDGQSIKTINFVRLLRASGWFEEVVEVDTRSYRSRRFRVFYSTLKGMLTCRDVVLMVSTNGKAFFYPFAFGAHRILRNRIFQNIIGGALPTILPDKPIWVRYLNSFEANWAETASMVCELESQGIENVTHIPNFRFKPTDTHVRTRVPTTKPHRFCTFSRVAESKGISEAMEAVSAVNMSLGHDAVTLDIYGAVEGGYEKDFNRLLSRHVGAVTYRGKASSTDAVSILSEYFMLLFPSTHRGEGMPGTLIDAMHAGLPAVVSDWRFNAEIIRHGKEGLVYSPESPRALSAAILEAIREPGKIHAMSANCVKRAKTYSEDAVLELISPHFASVDESERGD